jgi:hypothetical protein
MPETPSPRIVNGEIIVYRLFDLGYEVDLKRAEEIWQSQRGINSARKRLVTTPTKAVDYDVPPVELAFHTVMFDAGGRDLTADVLVRIYEFGVFSVALTIPANNLSWEAFSGLLNAIDAAIGPGTTSGIWQTLVGELQTLFAPALTRAALVALEEDYIIGRVRSFDEPLTAADIQTRLDLVPLLSGDHLPLSEGAREDLLRQRFSYYVDDFVVLTWDRAFVYEPRGDTDVLDVLEVANAQLLEMRAYDEMLDDELPRMYDLVESTRRARAMLSPRRFARLARRLYTLVAEVTELTERVDNALQVTEDVYLARIYTAALDLFRVRQVSAAVDRKLSIIRDTYAALYDEASSGRAALMELAIVVLIVVEIGLALAHRV